MKYLRPVVTTAFVKQGICDTPGAKVPEVRRKTMTSGTIRRGAGARGFLLKDVSVERLAEAIRQVASGATLIRPAVTERVEGRIRQMNPSFDSLDAPDHLTRRETEVLRMMAGGYSNREIAEGLNLSEGVIKNHVSNVLSKFGARDRTRAVLKGIELGYI